jgi:hypothetical protein
MLYTMMILFGVNRHQAPSYPEHNAAQRLSEWELRVASPLRRSVVIHAG